MRIPIHGMRPKILLRAAIIQTAGWQEGFLAMQLFELLVVRYNIIY